jgi:hypothetical protein
VLYTGGFLLLSNFVHVEEGGADPAMFEELDELEADAARAR